MTNYAILIALLTVSLGAFGNPLRVIIDAGHGGADGGTTNGTLKEKHITLKVAKELAKIIDEKGEGQFIPILTRKKDKYVSLNKRVRMANQKKGDVLVSIHVNSNPDSKATGTEFYFGNPKASDAESLALAARENKAHSSDDHGHRAPTATDVHDILKDLVQSDHIHLSQVLAENLYDFFRLKMKRKTRPIRKAPFRVLTANMPATLIELGFISNSKDAKWLNTRANHRRVAQNIFNGLKTFKEKLDKTRAQIIE